MHVLGIVGEIVIAVTHRQAALRNADDVVVGIFLVRRHEHREEEVVVLRGEVLQKVFPRADGIHFGDQGLERRGAVGVEPGGVHHHIVKVSDLLGDTSLLVILGGNVLDQGGEGLDIVIDNLHRGAPHRILRRLGVEVSPMAGGEAGEVIARTRGRVHVGIVDTGGLGRLGATRGDQCHCGSQEEKHFFHIVMF